MRRGYGRNRISFMGAEPVLNRPGETGGGGGGGGNPPQQQPPQQQAPQQQAPQGHGDPLAMPPLDEFFGSIQDQESEDDLSQFYSGMTPEERNGVNGDNPEITVANDAFLDQLFASPPGQQPSQGESDPMDLVINQLPTTEALVGEINTSLQAFALPEDVIPQDFNVNDPQQLRTVLTNASRAAVQRALATVFRPMEVAMQRMNAEVRRDMRREIQAGIGTNNEQTQLSREIPAINDPATRDVVLNMHRQARQRYPRAEDAIQATRRALLAIGVNPSGRQQPQQRGRAGGDPLDRYAPMPNLPPDNGGQAPQGANQQRQFAPPNQVRQSLRR
jgi:hypothetical protein